MNTIGQNQYFTEVNNVYEQWSSKLEIARGDFFIKGLVSTRLERHFSRNIINPFGGAGPGRSIKEHRDL